MRIPLPLVCFRHPLLLPPERCWRSQVALACHLRVASHKASLGLPEVLIGLLPGAGGTQRLPRLVKAEMALGMITTGKMVKTEVVSLVGRGKSFWVA